MVREMIPLFKVFMSESAPDAVADVLRSGYIGEGEKVKEFEKALGKFLGNPYVLCVNSGTSALKLGLIIAGVKRDNNVISTPMTCLATNTAILELGANIQWADVDPKTGLMDAGPINNVHINSYTTAIMCMHWGGNPCDVDELNKFGADVVEDACQALGSSNICKSRATAFSFQAIKTLTIGDGGAVVFQDKEDLERARLLKWFGLDREKSNDMRCDQDPPEAGFKMQMNDIAASIGLENLKHLGENLLLTYKNTLGLSNALIGHKSIESTMTYGELTVSSNWLYTILVDDSADFIAYMRNLNITCSKVHDRNDTKKIFAESKIDLPGVESFNSRHVCIPCGWWLTEDDVNRISEALRSYKDGKKTTSKKFSCYAENR